MEKHCVARLSDAHLELCLLGGGWLPVGSDAPQALSVILLDEAEKADAALRTNARAYYKYRSA